MVDKRKRIRGGDYPGLKEMRAAEVELAQSMLEQALDRKELVALKFCCERLIPPAKPRTVIPDFPYLPEETPTQRADVVIKYMMTGLTSLEEGQILLDALEKRQRIANVDAIDERLTALEAKQ